MNFTLAGLSDLQSLCCTFDGMRHSCFLMTGISVFFLYFYFTQYLLTDGQTAVHDKSGACDPAAGIG